MNVGALLVQQPIRQAITKVNDTNQETNGGFARLFQTMSSENATNIGESNDSIRTQLTEKNQSLQEIITSLMDDDQDLDELLASLGMDPVELQQLSNELTEEELNVLKESLAKINNDVDLDALSNQAMLMLQWLMTPMQETVASTNQGLEMSGDFFAQTVSTSAGKEVLQQVTSEQVMEVWGQVKEVLNHLTKGEVTNTLSVRLLKLMKQWTMMSKASPESTSQILGQDKSSTEAKLWNQLINAYHKRTDSSIRLSYQSNTTVTASDVSKWLKSALTRMSSDGNDANQVNNLTNTITGQPISKVQQFVIHINQSATGDQSAMQNELIEKFQSILKSSQFMSKLNGSNELLLKLNPKQLGDITVKLLQQNGEMLVKIMTNSQATKDALEANIQQLRHMFSPQQVVIEKQDAQSFLASQQEDYGSFDDQMAGSSQQENDTNEEHEDSTHEETLSFSELLWNEKV